MIAISRFLEISVGITWSAPDRGLAGTGAGSTLKPNIETRQFGIAAMSGVTSVSCLLYPRKMG
jgi:hypothetical protein